MQKPPKLDKRSTTDKERIAKLQSDNTILSKTVERVLAEGVTKELAHFMLNGKQHWMHDAIAEAFNNVLFHRYVAFPQKRGYTIDFYSRAFSLLPKTPQKILEIGVKEGASLVLWKALFPDAKIVGADIRPVQMTALLEGMTLVVADQAKPETIAEIGNKFGPFDFVVDDGSHVGEHMVNSLEALLPYLNPGALYVMEDTVSLPSKEANAARNDGKVTDLITALTSHLNSHWKGRPAPSLIQTRTRLLLVGYSMLGILLS